METKKEFTKEQLENIKSWGHQGLHTVHVASLLGLRPDQLRDERRLNKELNDALEKHTINFNIFVEAKLYELAISGKNPKFSNYVRMDLKKERICKQH